MKHRLLTGTLALSAACLFAQAELISLSVGNNQADYGTFRGRDLQTSPRKAADGQKKQNRVVGLYSQDGNFEDFDKYGTLELLYEEDFSLLTTGSEDKPDTSISDLNVPHQTEDDVPGLPREQWITSWNDMNPKYTHATNDKGEKYRWGIGGFYPAGGMVGTVTFDQEHPEAHVVTPRYDYTPCDGLVVVEFRAKGSSSQSILKVDVAETNHFAPNWSYPDDGFTFQNIPNQWVTYRVLFQNCGESTIMNIYGAGADGQMWLDDVKVYALKPHAATPKPVHFADFDGKSFKARWTKVDGVDGYLLDVWRIDYKSNRHEVLTDQAVNDTVYTVTDVDPDDVYYYQIRSKKGEYTSLPSTVEEVYGIKIPEIENLEALDNLGNNWTAHLEEIPSAFGNGIMAEMEREATEDGPFIITEEHFDGWSKDFYPNGQVFTKENPSHGETIVGFWYFDNLQQPGWEATDMQVYGDYLCLCPFFSTSTWGQQQSKWVSPEFDLSKDGGKVTIDMKVAAEFHEATQNYGQLAVALFAWNDAIQDYSQVGDAIYFSDLDFDWKNKTAVLTGGTERSKIGFFGVNSYGDVFIDDIVIKQNYKKGEKFYDPIFHQYWRVETDDPYAIDFAIQPRAAKHDVYLKARAGRLEIEGTGQQAHISKIVESDWSARKFVTTAGEYVGVGEIATDDNAPVEIYSISGMRVNNRDLKPGVYVVKRNGKATKHVVK